jgi:alkyl sulfatase BDS1-like metallo-beta-lactamase superfamily hydrolase
MGGADAVISKAKKDYMAGEYRWVAEALNHVVFAEPGNKAARELEANALEQLGYQAESGVWRNFYLTGARELREGIVKIPAKENSPDVIGAMSLGMIFDFMAIRLNGPKASGKTIKINWVLTDTGEKYLLTVADSVLNYFPGKQDAKADATVTLKRTTLNEVLSGQASFKNKIVSGQIKIKGNMFKLVELMELQDKFDPNFRIVDR